MRNLKTIENRVLAVLKEHPEARNDDMKPVSYTHLDVYKRQVLCSEEAHKGTDGYG